MVGREGKGGHSFLAIDHIRDQLIPPQVDTLLILRILNYFRKYPADNSLFHKYPDNNSLFRRGVTNYFRKYPDYNFLFH